MTFSHNFWAYNTIITIFRGHKKIYKHQDTPKYTNIILWNKTVLKQSLKQQISISWSERDYNLKKKKRGQTGIHAAHNYKQTNKSQYLW